MEAKLIQKYSKYSTPQLRLKAAKKFRTWIRKRDEGQSCISCDSQANQAGHYYSAGHYPALEFNPDNVHLQCTRCNMFLSGNLIEYRKRLLSRIGEERIEKLNELADYYKLHGYKHDRMNFIEILQIYK